MLTLLSTVRSARHCLRLGQLDSRRTRIGELPPAEDGSGCARNQAESDGQLGEGLLARNGGGREEEAAELRRVRWWTYWR